MELYSNIPLYILKDEKGIWYTVYDGTVRGYPSNVNKIEYSTIGDVLCKYTLVDISTLEHLKEELVKAGVKFGNN